MDLRRFLLNVGRWKMHLNSLAPKNFLQYFNCWRKFRFLIKFEFLVNIQVFDPKLGFSQKCWFWPIIWYLSQIVDFWRKFRISAKIWGFVQKLDFWPKMKVLRNKVVNFWKGKVSKIVFYDIMIFFIHRKGSFQDLWLIVRVLGEKRKNIFTTDKTATIGSWRFYDF